MIAETCKSRWTGERIARLGFLVGLGWDANHVAEDPIIASTPNNVFQTAKRFALSFRTAQTMSLGLCQEEYNNFELAAKKRGLSTWELECRILRELASDPNLLSNILDDGI